jgi:hypothetical protein
LIILFVDLNTKAKLSPENKEIPQNSKPSGTSVQ